VIETSLKISSLHFSDKGVQMRVTELLRQGCEHFFIRIAENNGMIQIMDNLSNLEGSFVYKPFL
jgi:hypothetical protein